MTIQRTVLFSLAALLSASTASAQCAWDRGAMVHPSFRHSVHRGAYGTYQPHVSYRPYPGATTYAQTAELPPAPSAVTFGACSHVDELASRLELLMNELCLDLYFNYSHNPDFHATYSEAYSLYQTARYIHGSVHNFDRQAVHQQLGGADALFHHIQEDVCGWTRIPRRQIGTLGIIAKMDMTEDALHHLMADVGVSITPGLEEPPTPQNLSVPPAPSVLP